MWLFCKHGFFSAVEHRDNNDLIMLRARFRGDLENLINAYFPDSGIEVTETPCADYLFRCVITKAQWSDAVSRIAREIDYDNFKNSVHDGTERDTAYLKCWYSLRSAQN